ncbi:MAG: choice-of-anchor J domain-containing protein [Mariniphaga sp.]
MKKIIAYILGLGLLISACNPMEDIYNELDQKENPYVERVELTLTDAEYDLLETSNAFFTEEEPAADFIPALLSAKYPALDYGSSAIVTYDFSVGYPDLSAYTGAGYYSLQDEDYEKVNPVVGTAKYFTPENPADESIPALLTESIPDAENGENYIVAYMYSDIEPEIDAPEEVTVFEYEFESSLGDFTTVNVLGVQSWNHDSYSGVGYAKMSGYSGGAVPNEDWLISPAIDLTGVTNATASVNQAVNYLDDQWDQIEILVSANYDSSDPATADWTEIVPATKPTGSNWTFVESENMDISAFDGQVVHIAFRYTSSDANAATWEVNKLTVKGTGSAAATVAATKSGTIVEPVKIEELYTYNDGWEKTEGAYYVKTVDYNAMGAPGQYDNFSSSASPDGYLPQLLEQKFPYAQEDEVMVVVYKYFSGGVQTRADEYHFTEGAWVKFNPVKTFTDQYIMTKSDGWVFDPTVMFTMSKPDYQIIVDWVKANKGSEFIDSYGTQEFWFGAGAYYGNYDIRDKWDTEAFDTWQDAIKASIAEVLLPAKFPDAVAQVSGIDVMYEVTFATYSGIGETHTWIFQCIKSGPNPEFIFVSEK